LRPGALDELLERYINNEHPLSRQTRSARNGSLYVVESRLAWTNGPLPATPAEVILRHLADEATLASHPALRHRSVIWEFRRHRLFLFAVHLRQAWRDVGRALGDWRHEAFEAGDWSRAGDGARLLLRAARASIGLSFAAFWTIGAGRPLPCPQRQVQRWAGSLAGSRLRVVQPVAAA
jgi:hypothetical protein